MDGFNIFRNTYKLLFKRLRVLEIATFFYDSYADSLWPLSTFQKLFGSKLENTGKV